jgi:hypothetical protein
MQDRRDDTIGRLTIPLQLDGNPWQARRHPLAIVLTLHLSGFAAHVKAVSSRIFNSQKLP